MKSGVVVLFVAGLTVCTPDPNQAQGSASDLVAIGVRQLAAARTTRSEAALKEAEETFAKALIQDPDNALALVHLGGIKVSRGGALATEGQFVPATELIQSGMADMNRAIALAPDQLDVRLTRGLSYSFFPAFYNLTAAARDDLEKAMRDPGFAQLPIETRDRVRQALEHLRTQSSASTSTGGPMRPDRFPNVSSATSPIVAAASATFPNARAGQTPDWIPYVEKALEGLPGLLGTHTVASVDHPGMFIVFTWWTNKQALNDFYYSDTHQGWVRGRALAITGQRTVAPQDVPSQVAIEVFAGLPGGMQLGSGFVPREVSEKK